MWFTEAYIKNISVKLIFKTFTLENSKKKTSVYIAQTRNTQLLLIVPVGSSSEDSLFNPEQIACYTDSVEKKNNDEEDEKI